MPILSREIQYSLLIGIIPALGFSVNFLEMELCSRLCIVREDDFKEFGDSLAFDTEGLGDIPAVVLEVGGCNASSSSR